MLSWLSGYFQGRPSEEQQRVQMEQYQRERKLDKYKKDMQLWEQREKNYLEYLETLEKVNKFREKCQSCNDYQGKFIEISSGKVMDGSENWGPIMSLIGDKRTGLPLFKKAECHIHGDLFGKLRFCNWRWKKPIHPDQPVSS